jgi:cytochrome oxidase Cu insertion factor (SCO1/SenC/PrrC family)
VIDASSVHAVLRPARGRLALVLGAALIVGVGGGVVLHDLLAGGSSARTGAAPPSGLDGQATWAAGVRPAPPITTLRDQAGRLFSLRSLRGRTVAMTFFDSHCNQACPLEGRAIAAAERALPAAHRPVLVIVGVNPRDTPASERAAVHKWGLAQAGSWHWLSGRPAQLAAVWRAYRIFVKPTSGDITHTEALYLIDRRGDQRSGYLYPFVPAFVSHDLKLLSAQRTGHV